MRALPIALALAALVAGCVTPVAVRPASDATGATAAASPAALRAGDLWTWTGHELVAPSLVDDPFGASRVACALPACERTTIHVDGPAFLQVAVEANDTGVDYATTTPNDPMQGLDYLTDNTFFFEMRVLDAKEQPAGAPHDSGHQGSLALVEDAGGDYTIEVRATGGTSAAYRGAVRVLAAPPERGAGLPDLALAPPGNLKITAPIGRELAAALDPTARGCGADEVASAKALRCLRYDTRIQNLGPGDFEERLAVDQAELSLAQQSAHWVQRIHDINGTRDAPSGLAVFHPVHGHFHLNGLQKAFIYKYDPATMTRGELVATGQKTGLCMVDGGIVDITGIVPVPSSRDNGCCYYGPFCPFDVSQREDFVQGISPGWFDTYPWWRADQYVDITGVPDGTYVLVSIVDPDGIVQEANDANNEASTAFELHGDAVRVLPGE